MRVYVDILFLINLIYDFLILNAVNIVLKRNVKVKKILYCSLVGGISAFSIFIPFLSNIYITIMLSVFMVYITFGFKDIIYFKNNLLYFYMIMITLGGFLYFINLKFNNLYNIKDAYNRKVLINFISMVIFGLVIYLLYLYINKYNNNAISNYFDVSICFDEKMYKLNGFYDTGNLIKDPYKNRKVILVDKKIIKSDIRNKSPIIVPCDMVNNHILINCYKPDLLVINNKVINNCLIGLWDKNMHDGIDVILNGYLGDIIR